MPSVWAPATSPSAMSETRSRSRRRWWAATPSCTPPGPCRSTVGGPPETMAVNEEGARNVLRHRGRERAHRIVHVSSTSALALSRDVRPQRRVGGLEGGWRYAGAKAAAECVARDLQDRGAPVSITYPSGVIGPSAGESLGEASAEIARFVASGIVPTPRGAISLIDVRDVAEIHVPAPGAGGPSSTGDVRGHVPHHARLGAELRRAHGAQIRSAAHPAPGAGRCRSSGRPPGIAPPVEPPITGEAMVIPTTWPGTEDNASTELGVQYRPVRETLTASIRAWLDAGLMTPRQAGALALSGRREI